MVCTPRQPCLPACASVTAVSAADCGRLRTGCGLLEGREAHDRPERRTCCDAAMPGVWARIARMAAWIRWRARATSRNEGLRWLTRQFTRLTRLRVSAQGRDAAVARSE